MNALEEGFPGDEGFLESAVGGSWWGWRPLQGQMPRFFGFGV